MIVKTIDCHDETFVTDSLCDEHKYYYNDYGFSSSFNYEYNINDCCLVRTTSFFPFDGVIKTPKNAYGTIKMDLPAIDMALNNIMQDIPYETRKSILEKYQISQRIYRSTSHYTINGLVGSHAYGNFTGNPFIILEPLKYHILDESLQSLQVEDTYFNDNVCLSDEAVIIIKNDVYEEIKDKDEYRDVLAKYRIYPYTGTNERLAVSTVLNELGYDCFSVSSNGYINGIDDGKPARSMFKFINNYALEHNISLDVHFGSEIDIHDSMAMINEVKEVAIEIVKLMCQSLNKDEKITNRLVNAVERNSLSADEGLIALIKEYSLENLLELVSNMNIEIENKVNALKEESIKTI